MLTILFIGLLIAVVLNIVKIAIKLTWGITKFVLGVILLPVILVSIAFAGFIYVALILLIIVGFISLIGSLTVS